MRSRRWKVTGRVLRIGMGASVALWTALPGRATADAPAGRVGRAVIAGVTPGAVATYPDKTAHDYPKGRLELHEGMALSEMHTLETDAHGRLCMALTPGALACVRPSTSIRLDRLEQMTDGLPESGKDLLRRIELSLTRGGMLLHGGVPTPNLIIHVVTPAGVVDAHGGEFVVMEDQGSWVIGASAGGVTFSTAGGKQEVTEGKLLRLTRDAAGKFSGRLEDSGVAPLVNRFDMCTEFFPDLEPLVFRPDGVDLGGLAGWIGSPAGVTMVGDPMVWSDVSPSVPVAAPETTLRSPAPAAPVGGGHWTVERIWEWYRSVGVIRGVNYRPHTVVKPGDFWRADAFKADEIDKELKLAKDSGFNSVRVQLELSIWNADRQGMLQRLQQFLDLASSHGLSVVPVLFDDSDVTSGTPGGANGNNVAALREQYVRAITGALRGDKRILFWDIYSSEQTGSVADKNLAVIESAFRWAREEHTRQPLTAAVWGGADDPISGRLMELSDLVTFGAFDSPPVFRARLKACEAFKRPVVCTDWMDRHNGNTFADILPILSERGVGWFSHSLVGNSVTATTATQATGRSQDLLKPDGKPYDNREIELIKAFQFIR